MLAGYLMGKGAKLQLTDKDGDNALHWAGFKGKYRSQLLVYFKQLLINQHLLQCVILGIKNQTSPMLNFYDDFID